LEDESQEKMLFSFFPEREKIPALFSLIFFEKEEIIYFFSFQPWQRIFALIKRQYGGYRETDLFPIRS